MRRLLFGLTLLSMPAGLQAQARSCAMPATVPVPRPDLPTDDQPRRVVPTGGYTLAISWAPEFCRTRRDDPAQAFQCGGARGRPRFGFVLHGLWPDGEGKDWPQYCAATGIVQPATIRRTMCATPSAQLIQHEWAKHGTCMAGETPESYFARSTAMFRALRFPDMDRLSRSPQTAATFARAFAAANPGLRPEMLRVTTKKTGWLDEVWLCRDLRFRPAACPAHQGGAAPGQPVRIWRGRA